MTLEESLAAKHISKLFNQGCSVAYTEKMTAKMLEGQGFGAEYSKEVTEKMVELLVYGD